MKPIKILLNYHKGSLLRGDIFATFAIKIHFKKIYIIANVDKPWILHNYKLCTM